MTYSKKHLRTKTEKMMTEKRMNWLWDLWWFQEEGLYLPTYDEIISKSEWWIMDTYELYCVQEQIMAEMIVYGEIDNFD